jgi:type VI protein secretion system component VasF
MSFNDLDAAGEIVKINAQLTAVLVQLAEMRVEVGALRRELDRVLSQSHEVRTVPTDKLPVWVFALAALAILILLIVYMGGRAGV